MPAESTSTRDWLLRSRFAPWQLSLCWCDARLGKLIIRDHRVAAVLDWEMACIGDPDSDPGWFAHIDRATSVGRSKSPFQRMAGLPDMPATMVHCERSTGRRAENLHYHEVFATW
jgi:aminoglycoside phosphotransferase (APT) family kinase protein